MRFAAALIAAASLATTHHPLHPRHCLYLKPRAELVCARKVLRVAKRGLRHPKSTNHSESYWRWAEEVSRRGIRAARYRLSHPPIPHLKLWLCIHAGEGNSGTSAAHENSGPLQMTRYWAGYPIYDWSLIPVYEVYSDAEAQLRIHEREGNAISWLNSQWWGDAHCFYLA